MFIKRLADTRVVGISHGRTKAYRYLTQDDECGFTMSTPRSPAGKGIVLWYQNHVEANYVLEGEGSVEDLTTGEKWDLAPGSVYFVGPKDRHQTQTSTGFYLLSVFNPPLVAARPTMTRAATRPAVPSPRPGDPSFELLLTRRDLGLLMGRRCAYGVRGPGLDEGLRVIRGLCQALP